MGKKRWNSRGKVSKKLRKNSWTREEVLILKKYFPNKPCDEVARKVGRPLYAVKRKAYRLGIHKSKKYLMSLGRA